MDNAITSERRRILIVDDEQGILNAVRRELSTPPFGRHHYDIEAFTSPLEALERAKVQEFEAVLSDYRMPEMTGLDFLKALAAIQPDCSRLVLSGQTDFDSLIQLINETHVYRFIPKPWSTYFLKSSLSQAIDFRQINVENRRLAKILRQQGIDLPRDAFNEIDQILVVDDDVNVANAVARDLTQRVGRLDEVYRQVREDAHGRVPEIDPSRISVQASSSAQHALKMAGEVEFSCIIADYLMPDMDGAQLLAAFAEKQPDCAAIMLSGAANMDGVVIALDLAHLHAFIAKPWTAYELRAAVAQALTRRRLALENRVLAQMCKARNLGAID
ncbi:MAG: response regulator [Sulfuritalea sp.]|nr:response regulator [Sulfuritalea sp.]